MDSTILLAVIGLAGNCVVASAFTFMGRAHAKERKFLINAALSGNTYEFAVRQAASADTRKPNSEETEYEQLPEGL